MKPELLALLLLILVSAVGVYIIKTSKSGIHEGYSQASRQAALECDKKYTQCLREGTSVADCTKASNTCISAIVNPSVSTATPAASSGISASSSAAAATGKIKGDMGTYDASGNPTGATLTNYNELYKLVNASAADRGQKASDSAYEQAVATLTPEFKTFLKQVQANVASKIEDPTDTQLALAQGAGVLPSAPQPSTTYTPAPTIIKAHEKPPITLPTMIAIAQTDRNTQAEQNLIDSVYTPSIRQMIRDDVKDVVREEIEANQISNPYAIDYQSY